MSGWRGPRAVDARVAPFFVFFFLTVATTVVGKTARNTLFLERFDADTLPWMYLGIAAVMAVAMPAYGRLGRRVGSPRLAVVAGAAFGVGTLAFALFDDAIANGALYVWVEVGTAILFFEYWMLAGQAFSARDGKRYFGLIGSGAGFANLIVGLGLGPVVDRVGTGILVPATALFALGSTAAAHWIVSARLDAGPTVPRRESRAQGAEPASPPAETRGYLVILGLAGAASIVVFTLVDYQFKAVAAQRYDAAELATFFGRMYAATGVGALLTQLLVTRRVLTRFGVVAGLSMLPVTQLIGAVALLVQPGLAAAVFLRGADRSLRFTIDQASRQILWLPLDGATQRRAKPIVDESVRHLAVGAAGLLLLASGGGVRWTSLLVLPCVGIWLLANHGLARGYVDRLREALVRHQPVFEPLRVDVADPEAAAVLRHALDAGDDSELLYVLGLIEDSDPSLFYPDIRRLWAGGSAVVRRRIVQMCQVDPEVLPEQDLREAASATESPALAADALRVCGRRPELRNVVVAGLESPHPRLRVVAATILLGSPGGGPKERATIEHTVRGALASADAPTRAAAAAVLRSAQGPASVDLGHALLDDRSSVVRVAALEALAERPDPRLLSEIVRNLGTPGVATHAARALAAHGEEGLSALLVSLGGKESPSVAEYRALATVLRRTRVRSAEVEATVQRLLLRERLAARERLDLHSALCGDPASRLWREHVRVELAGDIQALCHLAACLAPAHDLSAIAGVLQEPAGGRISDALEYLDNVVPRAQAAWLPGVLEELSEVVRTGGTEHLSSADPSSAGTRASAESARVRSALADLDASPHEWHQMLALHYRRTHDPNARGDPAMSTRLEKTLFLQKVDLFADLHGEQVAAIAAAVHDVDLLQGETLFSEGDAGETLYVIRSGRIELSRDAGIVASLERGDCFGEFAVLDGKPRTATARAARDTELLSLSRTDFLDATARYPAILEGVLRVLSARIRELVESTGAETGAARHSLGASG